MCPAVNRRGSRRRSASHDALPADSDKINIDGDDAKKLNAFLIDPAGIAHHVVAMGIASSHDNKEQSYDHETSRPGDIDDGVCCDGRAGLCRHDNFGQAVLAQ
jgi:hypothetical protein